MWLLGAHVGRQLIFNGAHLHNNNGEALYADRLNVGQNLFCGKGFDTQGEVRLLAARIGGQLIFDGARLSNEQGSALDLCDAKVIGSMWLRFVRSPRGVVNLEGAEVGAIYDDEKTWPSELRLSGLTYGGLEVRPVVDRESGISVKDRLRWLKLDPKGYAPQPYEQLIAFYRRAGDDKDARRVAIEKQRRRRDGLSLPAQAWSLFLGATVGHGYRAWFLFLWLLGLVGVGWFVFDRAYPEHFTAANGSPGISFQPLLYTLDLTLPVVNLHQNDAWIATGPARWGAVFTIAGWVLATLALAALTGLLKKD